MLYWAVIFLLVAIGASLFAFGGIATSANSMAQPLFVVALILSVVSAVVGFIGRNS